MKKILDFLEQNVQWVVIAAGVLYLGFMAWTFVINSPVSVTVDNEKLGPGDVDRLIVDRPVGTLNEQMGKTSPIKIPKLGWAEDFMTAMDLSRTKPVDLNNPLTESIVVPLDAVAGGGSFD